MNISLYVGHESCRDYKKVLKSPHWAIRRQRAVGMSSFRPLLHHASYLAKEHSVTHHSVYDSVNHSVNAGSNYVDLQAASSTTPGWMVDGATNNGGPIQAPFSNEQIPKSLFTSDHEACASRGKS